MSIPSLIVHGGAWSIPQTQVEDHVNGCRVAARAGWDMLTEGSSALDAVEAAVRVLEDDPTYDAGRGSVLNADGDIEMDAMIMDGATLSTGAVAAIQRVQHPVTVARLVMEQSDHTLLVGMGAETFARRLGVPVCPQVNLITERELERWRAAQQGSREPARKEFTHDTVGAVARDTQGHLAVATSTGGTFNKLPGRVGDSPLIGSGAYADDLSGAASATGWGEALMKIVISKSACDLIANGLSAQAAASTVIRRLAERVDGHGGIIVVDAQGGVGYAYNTPGMAYAYVTADGNIIAGC